MKEFIKHYAEVLLVFQKYGFRDPLIYRTLRDEHSDKVHIFVVDTLDIFQKIQLPLRYIEFSEELEKYFSCEVRLVMSHDLAPSDSAQSSSPRCPSLPLTADLTPQQLKSKLEEIFGQGWVLGQASWIRTAQKTLQHQTDIAYERLRASIHRAALFSKITTISKRLSASNQTSQLTSLTVQNLTLHEDNITQLTHAVRTNATLKRLVLSHNRLTFAQGKKFARALKHNAAIILFDISNNLLGESIKYFISMLKRNTTIESLLLGNNGHASQIALSFIKGFVNNQTLTSISLTGCHLGDASVMGIVFGLEENQTLTSLDLSFNGISTFGIRDVIKAAGQSSSWLSLNLSGNNIDNTNAQLLAGVLRQNSSLVKLTLTACELSDTSMSALFLALTSNKTLQIFDLRENLLSREGRKSLGEMLCLNTTLRILITESNTSSSRDIHCLSRALRKNRSLTALHLNNFFLDQCSLASMLLMLSQNQSLISMKINQTFLSHRETKLLTSAIKSHPTLTEFKIRNIEGEENTAKKINETIRHKQRALLSQRQAFIYFIVFLNYSLTLWRNLPLDIKQHIFTWLTFPDIRKSSSQIRDCTKFLSSHSTEIEALIKAKQKIILLEKIDLKGCSTFRFFKPSEEENFTPIASTKRHSCN